MTRNRDLKRLIRARMAKTGESYTSARSHLLSRQQHVPDPPGHAAMAELKPSAGSPSPAVRIRWRTGKRSGCRPLGFPWPAFAFSGPAIVLVIAVLLAGCSTRDRSEGVVANDTAGSQKTEKVQPPQELVGRSIVEAELERLVMSVMEVGRIPGAVVGVVHGERLVVRRAFGWNDVDLREPMLPETLFQIGSVTKVFAATLAALLDEEGTLDLQHTVGRYLPQDLAVPPALAGTTLIQLATHRAGLPKDPVNRRDLPYGPSVMLPYSTPELLEGLVDSRLRVTPEQGWRYSSLGYALLGYVLERAADIPFPELLRKRILCPLGMNDTGIHPGAAAEARLATPYWADDDPPIARPRWEFGEVSAFGGLYSSVDDLARFVAAQYDPSDPLLSAGVRRVLHEPRVQIAADPWPMMSLGWRVYPLPGDRTALVHAGEVDGYSACVAVLPADQAGYIVLTNVGGNAAEILCMELLPVVLRSLATS